ncbi:ribosome small subunit-dependent GTPase A [Shimazuella kribbensis]|uniref:ribosome small subunit-dependent GTPase A n=1 Tax=Shimazuella kribbensis TaxID=139808 RepID=UPI0004015C21|nr:ribosome small subunit-dependent GTPase A [Shimazuella kribbensis]
MPSGQIIKAISGFFYVKSDDREVIQCRARGIFKFEKKKIKPLVGDLVTWESTGLDQGVVTSVQPRSTELLRPPIANVEQAVVVCALREPKFQSLPLDRFLVHAEKEKLRIVICLTKKDLVEQLEDIEMIKEMYSKADYPIVTTSIRTGEGIDELLEMLKGETTVFAGLSGVGKSSLLNHILPDSNQQVGAVSEKIGRGRHTTRQVELLPLKDGGQIADTPGFSQLGLQGMTAEELTYAFPEYHTYLESCRFRGCYHQNEPGCAVKEGVKAGELNEKRYEHYLLFLSEIQQERRY